MYCTHCGKEIDDKAVVCVHCGLLTENGKFINAQMSLPPEARPAPAPTDQAPRQMKKFNPFAITGFAIAAASVLIAVFSFSINVILVEAEPSGLTSFFSSLIFFSLFGAICGIVFSAVGLALRKRYARGMGFGIAGLIISIIHFLTLVVIYLIAILAVVGFFYLLIFLAGAGSAF